MDINMESRIVIVAYKPKAGKESELRGLARDHYGILKQQGLVTDRMPVLMESKDGTIIEVFEWESREAIASAHSNGAIARLWEEFGRVCDYVPVGQVAECRDLFAEFNPVP